MKTTDTHCLVLPQFGAQEPGSHEEILEFVKKYDINMSQKMVFFEKSDVNGPNTREVYSFLKEACPDVNGGKKISWNFVKFLVDHNGVPFKRYSHRTPPFDMKGDIETLLRNKETLGI